MREVSCKALDLFFRELKKRGLPPGILAEGVPYSVAHLKDKNERIEWAVYCRVMANAERIWSRDDFVRIGGSFFSNPVVRSFALVGRLLFTARDFYRWMNVKREGMGNQLFTCVDPELEEIGPDRIRITLTLPEGYERCRPFFWTSAGAMRDMPKILGLRSAGIEMIETPRGAVYEIGIPPGGGTLPRLRKALSYPFAARAVAQELKEANEVLTARYFQLEEARDRLDRQATQLRTAHAISQAVHGDLDLERTLAAVARALVHVAGFAAARIQLDADVEGRRLTLSSETGDLAGDDDPIRVELEVRGHVVGALILRPADGADREERLQLLEYVTPVVLMAIENALAYTAVTEYRSSLEEKVDRRTHELTEAIARLEEAQAVRERIFANISHEIRTPLSLTLLAIRRIEADAEPPSPPIRALLRGIERNSQVLLRLVDGLLLLAAGQKLRLERRVLDLGGLARATAEVWRPAADENGLSLEIDALSPARVEGDAAALDRALSNLIGNAMSFTERGGIEVRVYRRDASVCLEVRDTGVGVSDDARERIFERFAQDKPPVRGGAWGSGVGLSIVQEIAKAHEGRVELEPREGGGSVFRIVLPAAKQAERAASGTRAEADSRSEAQASWQGTGAAVEPGVPNVPGPIDRAPHVPAAPCVLGPELGAEARILVVEDEPEMLRELGALLSSRYQVTLVEDGEEALRVAEADCPDLLITDVALPRLDGFELTRRFLERHRHRFVPVLLLTAYGDLGNRLRGFDAGAVDYVQKPFEPEELRARVRSLLSLRDLAFRLHRSEQLASIGLLSSGLAHEIRNPANSLINALAPLRRSLPEGVFEPGGAVEELFSVLDESASQIAHLSRQLLDYAGRGELKMSEVSASVLVERALLLNEPNLREVRTVLDLGFEGELVCAPSFLVQALSNLVKNAAEAAGPGGEVRIQTRASGGRFVLEVSDTGPGILPKHRDRIFEPFFTTKPPGKGTGLGLMTARHIVVQHAGTLEIGDSPKGALFRITLPLGREGLPRGLGPGDSPGTTA